MLPFADRFCIWRTTTWILIVGCLISGVFSQNCAPDYLEPNDDWRNATVIDLHTDFDSLTLCTNDVDWFSMTVPNGGHVDGFYDRYPFQANSGPTVLITVYRYNAATNNITFFQQSYESFSNNYSPLQTKQMPAGTYYFNVSPASLLNDVLWEYRLNLTWIEGLACPNDLQNYYVETAIPLPVDTTMSGMSLCGYSTGSNNYYVINVTVPSNITVLAGYPNQEYFDIELYLYNTTYDYPIASADSTDNPEVMKANVAAGIYYIGAEDFWDMEYDIRNYTMRWTAVPVPLPSSTSSSSSSTSVPSSTQVPVGINSGDGKDKDNTTSAVGLAVGVTIGVIFLFAILAVIAFLLWRNLRRSQIPRHHHGHQTQVAMVPINHASFTPVTPVTPVIPVTPIIVTPPAPVFAQQQSYTYDKIDSPGHSASGKISGGTSGGGSGGKQVYGVILPVTVGEPQLEKSCDIDYRQLEDLKPIGTGSYGTVFRATWRETIVAVKQLHTSLSDDPKALSDFKGEVEILSALRPHPNVVLFMGLTSPPQPLTIVTEFCAGGSLYSILKNMNFSINASVQKKFLLGIGRGMLHLHSEGIVHRDLAARNVLLTENLDPKVSDFGLSRKDDAESGNQTKSGVGPLKWMPPEAIRDKVYSTQSDVWSYGVVIWEIITRSDPWPETDTVTAAMRVCYEGLRLQFPPSADVRLVQLAQACWETDPAKRPTMKEICNILNTWTPAAATTYDSMAPYTPQPAAPSTYDRI